MKVMIVEDEMVEALALQKILKQYYSNVIKGIFICSNGRDAIMQFKKEKYDIIFMDISMPYIDGIATSEQIRIHDKDVIIIMLTAYSDFDYARRSIENQVFAYITKPYSVKTLQGVIDKILNEKDISTEQDDIIVQAKKYMKANYENEIKLNDIADSISVSKYYLSRIFKAKTGENITDYLLRLRLDKAKQLLQQNYNVKEVTFKTGFSNPAYFSKCFKKEMNMSPGEYKSNYESSN